VRYLDTNIQGGFIESEKNLSQEGNARVYGDAIVFGDACVSGNACIYGNAQVSGNAAVYGDACVFGNARIYGYASVFDLAWVYGNAQVFDDAKVFDDAIVSGNAFISGNAIVSGNAFISGSARVYGKVGTFNGTKIISGSWEEPPLQIRGSRFLFSVVGEGIIAVGCHTLTVEEWRNVYKEKFAEHNFTAEEREEYISYFNKASEMYNFGFTPPLPDGNSNTL
jgi:carbonic anhydrase/acetyltransferase-like protein (isoleucine patch superfamily)